MAKWICRKCNKYSEACRIDTGDSQSEKPTVCLFTGKGNIENVNWEPDGEPLLKPCPFCGGEAKILKGTYGYYPYCCNCQCLLNTDYKTKQDVIEAWNRRA